MAMWDIDSLAQHLLTHSSALSDSFRQIKAYTTVSPTQGFHITSTTDISGLSALIYNKSCFAGSLQLVPPDFIVDEYELNQRYQEGYGPLCHVIGERDLELPVQAVGNRSSLIIAELPLQPNVKIDMPLHLRYPHPQKNVGFAEVQLPWPWIVILCDQQDYSAHRFLGQVFNNETITARYTISSPLDSPHPSSRVLVPTGNISHQPWVETGTLLSVLITFFYVARSLQKYCRTDNTKLKES